MDAKLKTTAMEELERATEDLIAGRRDPQEMRKACDRVDRARERLRKKVGTLDVAVELSKRDE